MEKDPCYTFEQSEGTLFVLDPDDEVPKCRRNKNGCRRQDALFSHGVKTNKEKDYFSVAFIFRCLETTATVDSATDHVVPPQAEALKEKQRRAV